MKKENPCHYCEDRYSGCHSVCEKYIAWKKIHEEERLKERARRQDECQAYFSKRGRKRK